ncbi:hypothetical protein MRS44_011000 [Fusarium solani]|uniref:uncharacterized protein n=1 Tax=Fusarium solani TaxID=169388 RepID=UPI0032C4765B|nr:hypothetical protein MRS44_011000 [Fusarium solani]
MWHFKRISGARIIDNELYLRRRHVIKGPPVSVASFKYLLESVDLPLCRHIRPSGDFRVDSRYYYDVDMGLSEIRTLNLSDDVHVSRSCRVCYTDYILVIKNPNTSTGWTLDLTTFHRFSYCSSLSDPIWQCATRSAADLRNLSFQSDKLIAFSAILKHFSVVHKEEIVAGMRRGYLEDDLLWRVPKQRDQPEGSCYETYIAPSWSWASVKGRVLKGDYGGRDYLDKRFILVEDYKLHYATEDMTGAIRGGWLRLSGSPKQLKLFRCYNGTSNLFTWELAVEGAKARGFGKHIYWDVDLDDPAENFEQDSDNDMLFCMPGGDRSTEFWKSATQYLLLKLVNRGTGTFRRIGLASETEETVWEMLPANDRSESTAFAQRRLPWMGAGFQDG